MQEKKSPYAALRRVFKVKRRFFEIFVQKSLSPASSIFYLTSGDLPCDIMQVENSELLRLYHGRLNYKDTEPYMSAFFIIDLLTDFAACV
jgi:hypothetical protein